MFENRKYEHLLESTTTECTFRTYDIDPKFKYSDLTEEEKADAFFAYLDDLNEQEKAQKYLEIKSGRLPERPVTMILAPRPPLPM